MEPPFDRLERAPDPGLARLFNGVRLHRRRVVGGVVVAIGVLVLVISVLVSAASASGSTVHYSTTATPSAAAPATPSPSPTQLLVQVVGQVKHPGLVHLPEGARAIDAVTAAGGALPNADEAAVDLAARVTDGQQLVVPKLGAAPPASTAGAAAGATTSSPVSLSSASEVQLETLPRIGPAMAARIIAYRTAHGGFAKVDDLLNVGGIGAKTLAALKPLVTP